MTRPLERHLLIYMQFLIKDFVVSSNSIIVGIVTLDIQRINFICGIKNKQRINDSNNHIFTFDSVAYTSPSATFICCHALNTGRRTSVGGWIIDLK